MSAARWSRAAAALLPHINLLLAVLAGGALASAARLRWDPSAYIPLRELAPGEYRAVLMALPAAAAAQLLLAHTAIIALQPSPQRPTRFLLYIYAVVTLSLATCEVWVAAWAWRRLRAWRASPAAQDLQQLQRDLADHLRPLLAALARLYPHALPDKLTGIIAEVEEDLPRNVHVALAAAAALLVLQLAAAAAALLAASQPRASHMRTQRNANGIRYSSSYGDGDGDSERRPLRRSMS